MTEIEFLKENAINRVSRHCRIRCILWRQDGIDWMFYVTAELEAETLRQAT